jgi:hypothetical protein
MYCILKFIEVSSFTEDILDIKNLCKNANLQYHPYFFYINKV